MSVTNLTSNVPSPLLTTVAPFKAGFATKLVSPSKPSDDGLTSAGSSEEPLICRAGTPAAVSVVRILVIFALAITSVEGIAQVYRCGKFT